MDDQSLRQRAIRLAATMPSGSTERRALLEVLAYPTPAQVEPRELRVVPAKVKDLARKLFTRTEELVGGGTVRKEYPTIHTLKLADKFTDAPFAQSVLRKLEIEVKEIVSATKDSVVSELGASLIREFRAWVESRMQPPV